MRRAGIAALLIVAALAVSAAARAQTAFTTRDVNLRAGPDREYPLVTWLPEGTLVTVIGCIDGYRWCDVIASPYRGWVYAGFLAYPYQGQDVTILSGGPLLGLPLVGFSLGLYWDNYYRRWPWYADRPYWIHRPPRYYRPPPHRPPYYRPPPVARPPYVRPLPPPGARPSRPPGARPSPPPGARPSPPPGARPSPPPGARPSPPPGARPSPQPGFRPSPSPGARPFPSPGARPSPPSSARPSPPSGGSRLPPGSHGPGGGGGRP